MIEKEIPLDDIKVLSNRTRTSKEKKSDMDKLVDSIKKLGLFHPILINEDYELVAGFRRLTAYKILRSQDPIRFGKIKVRILPAGDEYNQLEAEIHENWARKELRGYELDTALARLKRIYQRLHPETIKHVAGGIGKSEKSKKKSASGGTAVAREKIPRFEEYMAEDLMQKSVSTIEKRVRVGEAIEKKVFTEPEVEAYKEGEKSHTEMLKTYELRKKLENSIKTEVKKDIKKKPEVKIEKPAPPPIAHYKYTFYIEGNPELSLDYAELDSVRVSIERIAKNINFWKRIGEPSGIKIEVTRYENDDV